MMQRIKEHVQTNSSARSRSDQQWINTPSGILPFEESADAEGSIVGHRLL